MSPCVRADSLARTPFTGLSHGIAGTLLALECANERGFRDLSADVRQRCLDALVASSRSLPRGALVWPRIVGDRVLGHQSWCHGTPGIALALLAMYRLTREPAYRELAERGLEGVEALLPRVVYPTFCCGRVGIGHILLEAYRVLGDTRRLEGARAIASSVAEGERMKRRTLLSGRLGLSFLEWRLDDPTRRNMPGLGALSASRS